MENELILLSEYITNSHVELDFVRRLEDEGLIETIVRDNLKYIFLSQLGDLETFSHLYYDLSINVEGIDVIHNLLKRLHEMEQELAILRRQLNSDAISGDEY